MADNPVSPTSKGPIASEEGEAVEAGQSGSISESQTTSTLAIPSGTAEALLARRAKRASEARERWSGVADEWVALNVGGTLFRTTRTTLEIDPHTMLAALVAGNVPSARDETGAILIDRDPQYFRVVLNFLRHGVLSRDAGVSLDGVFEEARFFNVEALVEILAPATRPDFASRPDFVVAKDTIGSFAGLRLLGLDLSSLDLADRVFNRCLLDDASLASCNLSKSQFHNVAARGCNFSRANLFRASLRDASLMEASFSHANLEEANFYGSDMVNVDMQHTLCKSALFQRTRMCGADFSFADLTSARMQRCDLRDAVLTDANLDSASLKEADLRGATLTWVAGMRCVGALVTQGQYDAIPLDAVDRERLRLRVVAPGFDPDAVGEEIGLGVHVVAGTGGNGARLRNVPNGDIIAVMPEGDRVEILTINRDEEAGAPGNDGADNPQANPNGGGGGGNNHLTLVGGAYWRRVSWEDQVGYVVSMFLRRLHPEEVEAEDGGA